MITSSAPILKNILIVDDQPENLRVLTQLLTGKGYKVRKAIDGESAILAANSTPPDLILLDIMMPNMDGYQVCQELKTSEKTHEIPVIFISALDDVMDKVKGFELGCVDYITKPFKVEEVIARIEVHLQLQYHKKALNKKNKRLKQVIRERREAEAQLRLLQQAIADCGNGVLITDASQSDNPIIYVNPTFERFTGYSFEEVRGKNPRFLQGRDRKQPNLNIIRNAMKQGKSCQVILRNYHKNGEFYYHEVFISPIKDKKGIVTHFVGIQNDITDRKKIEEALIRSEQKFASAFRASPDPITISTLRENRYIEVNQSFCNLTEYSKAEIINHTPLELNLWVDYSRRLQLIQQLEQSQSVHDFELQFRSKSGEIKTLLVSAEILELESENCLLTIAKDITERQKIKQALEEANIELYRLANLDGLTQVANRRRLDDTLQLEWQRCYREKQPLSLIICDVDEFKRYNDFYGHPTGDDCLIQVAQTINNTVQRATDLVARFGGEEFVVILPNTDEIGAIQVANKIQRSICDLHIVHANSTVSSQVTISLGIASLIPQDNLDPTLLIKRADNALFEAKKQGRNRIIVYQSENKNDD